MFKKARLLTRPTPARQDAPFRGQGHNFAADPRFTFHASRFTVPGAMRERRMGKDASRRAGVGWVR
ncbi:MAG: hypothetical protein ACREI1_00255, partial [Nitrospiraceae bacterium]